MPVFTIDAPNGDTYEIEAPAGATKDQAFEFFKREHSAGRVQPKPKKQSALLDNPVTGAGETALTMLTGVFSQPLSGLAGLATGSADTVRDVQEALTYQPHGATGKRYAENVGKVFNYPIEKAGELAYNTTGSEAARSIAEAGTEIGLNFLPLGAVAKGGKKLLSRKPIEVPPVRDISAVEKAISENTPEVKPTETIYTDAAGNARTSLPDLGELTARKAQEKARIEALNKRVEEVRPTQEAFNRMSDEELQAYRESQIPEGPVDKQMDLPFDASPEEMAFHRSQQEPQMDMFAEDIQRNPVESTPDRSVPPNPQMDLLPDQAMLERRWNNVPPETPIDRQRQIEEAYAQRDQQRSLEEQQRALEERLMSLEERLREEAYQPPTRKQLRAERGRPGKAGMYRNSQRGAIDPDLLTLGFTRLFHGGREFKKWNPKTIGSGEGMGVLGPGLYASDKRGLAENYVKYGNTSDFDIDAWLLDPNYEAPAVKPGVLSELAVDMSKFMDPRKEFPSHMVEAYEKATKALDALGLKASRRGVKGALQNAEPFEKQAAREAVVKAGIDGIWEDLGEQGREIVIFNPDIIAQVSRADTPVEKFTGSSGRFSQRGGIDLQSISDGFQKIFNLNKKSPEVQIATKELSQRRKQAQVQNILNNTSGYVENIRTPAEVIAASQTAKDIPASALLGGKTVTPGANALAIKHPNPLIKYLRYGKNEINHFVTGASEKFITSKEGIGATIKKLSPKELTEAVQLLQLGDKKQIKISEEVMRKNGYSDKQIEFVKKFYEMDKFKLDLWNRKLEESGMPTVESREGHVPGIFKGDFKQLVLNSDNKPIGFIGVDFKWQLEAARKKMLEKFPDAKFTEVSRSKLGGSGVQKAQFGEMQEVLKMLAEHDPSFADVQKMIDLAIKENSNAAYGAAYHSMKKKGIVGNEGNKPWENPEQNAKDFVKAYLQHWEEGVTSHAMLPFERDMRALMQNPELKNSERAKEYVNEYIKNMTGRSVGDVGQALNTLLDAPFKLTGLGKSTPKEIVNQLNKRAGQWTMGFGNILYTLAQYIQVAQSALPEMQSMARQLKIPLGEVTPAFTKAVSQLASHYLGKESPTDATVFKEARDRGLLTFSEFSDINKITQNKHSAAFDKAVDFSRNELGERPTRPVVFFAAVDVLKRQGLEGKVLYDTAYNMTQAAMIDYHAWERPMMYGSAGVTGNLAGTLATYKHGYLNQLNRFASEARKGNVMPLISAATMLFAFAGLRGIPGYDDLNSVVEYMTEKFGGKRQNISEITMSNLPEWAKSGALSASTNVNMQGRLSTANVLPDSPVEAISPWASFYGKIGSAAGDVISNRDELSLRNLGATLLPSGPLKGIGERALNTDDQGYLLDKHGLKGNERSEWDKDVRLFTGGTSLSQSLTSTNQYMSTKRLKGYKETQKGIIQDLERKYVQGTLTDEDTKEAAKKFIDAKGDPEQLVESMIKYATTVKLNKQQRLQGIPNGSLSSLYKYQEYSDDVVR